LIVVICGYLFGWKWTGLPKQTLWDWLDLLIVPAVLAVGGYLFTRSENRSTQAAAERRALDGTLQAYLDGMAQLLTDRDQPLHSTQPGDSLSSVARARTLTVLVRLDGSRKRSVLQFLYESGLINKERTLLNESGLIERRHNIVSLQQADLRGANLREAYLGSSNLSEANLSEADLSEADLRGAGLSEANLSGADLTDAKVTVELLRHVLDSCSLEGAIMPNGQKYEDWLKDREGRKQNE
jgi:hypothetical protein